MRNKNWHIKTFQTKKIFFVYFFNKQELQMQKANKHDQKCIAINTNSINP